MRPKLTVLPTLVLLVAALGAMFDRTWRFGEVVSPADLLDSFYPWTYDAPRREPANATRSDEALYHQPLIATHWPRLAQGDLPEWDPWVLAGTPAFHQGLDVGRAFSPLSAPYYLWPVDVATTIYGALRLFVAGLLMWWYLHAAGLSPPACALGALAFALNGAFIVWLTAPMPTVALWLPLVLLAVERLCARPRLRDAALLAAGLGFQFLGAYLPTSLVVLAVTGVWAAGWLATMPPPSPAAPSVSRTRALGWLVGGGLVGLALGAAALWPMLATLIDSPAGGRSMRAFTLPWQNLATFALPDFWGSPLSHTWWYSGRGNYPEFVTYLGVLPVVLAVVGAIVRRGPRVWLAALVGALALMQMYGWPPGSWLGGLPGLRQMNPFRWNIALAFSVSVLAAHGLDVCLAGATSAPSVRARGERVRLRLAAGLGFLVILGAAAVGVFGELDAIRQLGLQAYEKTQLAMFGGWWLIGLVLVGLVTRPRSGGALVAIAWLLGAATAVDLVIAGRGFNPSAPPSSLYTTTPAIDFVRRELKEDRIAPVGASWLLPQSHVWGMYGLPSITGFDFFGDQTYQAFIAAAAGRADADASVARWDHVGIEPPVQLSLRLLGLLRVGLIVTPPVDTMTHDAGYTTVGAMIRGRTVEQSLVVNHAGFRRVDLLVATHGRSNAGAWSIAIDRLEDGARLASSRIDTRTLRDLDWLTLRFPPQADSRGRRYRVRIVVDDASGDGTATLMATTGGGLPGSTLTIDGRPEPRALWLRALSDAPDAVPGASLVYAHDLNVYRNPMVMPPAWFVRSVSVLPLPRHVSAIEAPDFDPAATVVVEAPLPGEHAPATVVSWDGRRGDVRVARVDAPQGGVVVFSERYAPHWRLDIDGRPAALVRADSILMAAAVPPGAATLTLRYQRTDWSVAFLVSALSLVGILIALISRR